MGTKFKTKEETFEHRIRSQLSVESCIILTLRDKKCFSWMNGLSFIKLKGEVERRRKRDFCDGRVYEAISLINRYGKRFAVYIRSGFGYVEDENNKRKIEYRYFVPKELPDINDEKRDLDNREEIIDLKKSHLQHHEEITIPQEQKLAQIQR